MRRTDVFMTALTPKFRVGKSEGASGWEVGRGEGVGWEVGRGEGVGGVEVKKTPRKLINRLTPHV